MLESSDLPLTFGGMWNLAEYDFAWPHLTRPLTETEHNEKLHLEAIAAFDVLLKGEPLLLGEAACRAAWELGRTYLLTWQRFTGELQVRTHDIAGVLLMIVTGKAEIRNKLRFLMCRSFKYSESLRVSLCSG